jgi:transcriptional regulator with XRE-family HTH domain
MSIKQSEEIIKSFLTKKRDDKWREAVDFREANKSWLQKSAKIAIKIMRALRDQKMSQKDLAQKLGVSAQQVNKILKGRENLKLETIAKFENVLNIELINVKDQSEIDQMINSAIMDYHRRWTKSKDYARESGISGDVGALLCIEEENDYAKRDESKIFTIGTSYIRITEFEL